MNNYIYNLTHTKKDIKKLLSVTFIMYAVSVFPCRNIFVALVIVLIASVILTSIYIVISKKFLDEKKVMKMCGAIGIFNSFIFALITAYQKGKTFIEMLITFSIMIGIILGIIVLLEIASRTTSIWKKNKPSIVSSAVISIFAALGMITSRYFFRNGIEMRFEFIYGSFSIIFALFYGAFIKAKHSDQSEDSSVIDG